MISPELFFNACKKEGVNFFSGVPDSLLKNMCAYISDNTSEKNHIIAANEGNALSLGIGYHLATGQLPLIYMQNSGLGNIVNPLLSLADSDVYAIPMLLMIGWRGEPNIKDEPQHKKQGRVTIALLESMEIPYSVLSSETSNAEAVKIIREAVSISQKNNTPFALVVKKDSFESYGIKNDSKGDYPLLREQAIKLVVDGLGDNDVVVATTGVASRELFEYREALCQGHEKDFLTVGGMGHASQIAVGIALQKSDRNVFCFDGDGAMLMHMGSLAINANTKCTNFKHIIFNNGAHDSVGGQPTVGYQIDVKSIASALGYSKVLQATNESEIKNALEELHQYDGMVLLEIRVNKGFRSNLGRPSTTPIENKKALMNFLN